MTTLVCAREAGHAGPHATLNAGAPVAQWPVVWTAEDQARYDQRHATWRKPHTRRAYVPPSQAALYVPKVDP